MKLLKGLTSRLFLTILLLLIQLIIIVLLLQHLYDTFTWMYWIIQIIGILVVITIFNKDESPSIKLPWVVFIMVVPVVGLLFYFLTTDTKMQNRYKKNNVLVKQMFKDSLHDYEEVTHLNDNKTWNHTANYIKTYTELPVQRNTSFMYFKVGEDMFHQLLIDLNDAKHFIFMEYFIITDGYFWNEIKTVLIRKAKAGVEVKLIYDDLGCLVKLHKNTKRELEESGVQVVSYNPVVPIVSIKHNTRDHRKITVIDGYIGYTGGLNIGDEYINRTHPLGHWKDTAIRLFGEGTLQFTLIFMQTWKFEKPTTFIMEKYIPHAYHDSTFESDGYMQAYLDSPLNDHLIGQSNYMNILNQAKDYVYMLSPYFIVDNEMLTAICLAAQRGVDVVLILPHIADKWYVQVEARSYYKRLINANVKVYEYTPGFMHAKSFICDDSIAVIGTSNLDYRSLYHHLECGINIYDSSILKDIKEDFVQTIHTSQCYTVEMYERTSLRHRFIGSILKFFSPLM